MLIDNKLLHQMLCNLTEEITFNSPWNETVLWEQNDHITV